MTLIIQHSRYIITMLILATFLTSCVEQTEEKKMVVANTSNTTAFLNVMQKHLDAVSNRDLETLKSTMAPNGKMQLILPQSEIFEGVDSFMDYHRAWFKDSLWTFETRILNTEVDQNLGMAITEVVYREPERNGEPYFNRMIVSYTLEKIDDHWYIIKDHASSVEKSTDK
ncbi:nuclear transport factor 2 family protein [Rasiella rasia]|uniref:Nuclear transport factor 2 family protein n=1 Tax=Rasiella rasia TaxID=2744027 RepID=A0A6G6GQ40_9FLAO|nr:nuclear transport factor 2 family protein [Rasiella rasia]QIE60668.1 nuclear transport factor 2 family protein [Rasiella rasia]